MIGNMIKQRRLQLGITQQQLADKIGIKKNTVSNYECNVSSPSEDVIMQLMEVLQCDANYLFEWETQKEFKPTHDEIRGIKKYRGLDEHGKKVVSFILSEEYTRCESDKSDQKEIISMIKIKHSVYKVSAGRGFYLGDEDDWTDIDVPDTPEARKANFALTIQGDSMEPIYFDGDIVLVKQQDIVDVGEVGIFVLNGAGYIKKNGGNRLISLNEKYDDIVISEYDNCKCFGKVVGRI